MDAVPDTVDRAAKLTGQLLAFARRQALKLEVFDIGPQLGAVADMPDAVTGARIRVVTEVPDAPCFVDLTGWLWTGLIERISQDRRSWT